jgi:hypothetical protein
MAIDKITASGLGDGGVSTADIAADAVTTTKIADANVTLAKLSATGTKDNTTFLRGDNSFQVVAVTPTAVSDQANTSTGGFSMPAGTTAQRSGSPDTGESRYNSTTGSLEFYDGSNWISTNLIPTINSITGDINNTYASNLVFSLTNNTDTVDVVFSEGGSAFHTITGQSVSSGAVTIATPSQVYGQTAGDTISISIRNSDGTPSSNGITKTVITAPTGGTITTYGSYRVHTFTSTANFVAGGALTADVLVVAGGGGGGAANGGDGGGGGAGGMIVSSGFSVSSGTYSVTVGGGGAGSTSGAAGSNGANSVFSSLTAIGGGGGGSGYTAANSGGSGGAPGSNGSNQGATGAGTAGQGNAGFRDNGGEGTGGGGAGATGASNGDGGAGLVNTFKTGSNTTYAGGGGGGRDGRNTSGGSGGGGNGHSTSGNTAGATNTGGGGGASGGSANGRAGGSGIVVIRYAI